MRFVLLAALMPALGCGLWNPFIPDTQTPADRARDLMPKCSSETGEGEGVGPAAIEQVTPLTSVVPSGNDRAIHLRGAELHMRPIDATSPEGLQRRLECHEALVTLGRAAPMVDDPYVLDGQWLRLKVRSDGDGFVVSVQTDVLEQAKIVLARAERFGAGAGRGASAEGSAPASATP